MKIPKTQSQTSFAEVRPEWKEFIEFARERRKKGRIARVKLDAQLATLKQGGKISQPEYDFAMGATV